MNEIEIEKKILEFRNELKTDRLDMSFGEIMNLYEEGDLIITPEYQRAYRWKHYQKTRFIESILLGIPIPPIFVAEDKEGKWELVDGLQRISTIFTFFGALKNNKNNKNNFALTETDLLGNILENITLEKLSTKLKLTIKRAVCRVEILRWDSKLDMRYELFNRLNTGATPLKPQEIRNCIFIGDLNNSIQKLASNKNFIELVNPTDNQKDEMFLEELVLRHFAFKSKYNNLIIEKSIQDFLSNYMKEVNEKRVVIKLIDYERAFIETINYLTQNFDYKIFRAKNGLLTPNIFDTIMYVTDKYFNIYSDDINKFKENLKILNEDVAYKEASGSSTYASKRMQLKIARAEEIFND